MLSSLSLDRNAEKIQHDSGGHIWEGRPEIHVWCFLLRDRLARRLKLYSTCCTKRISFGGRWDENSAAHCIPLLFGKDCSLTSTPFWIFCWGLQLHGLNLLPLVSHEDCSFSLLFYYLSLQPCSTNCIQISSTTIHVPLIISIGYNQASVEEPRTFSYTHDLPR